MPTTLNPQWLFSNAGDYQDYLRTRVLPLWNDDHARYKKMVEYCYAHHELEGYCRYIEVLDDENYCNTALTLLHQTDKGLVNYLAKIEESFLKEGGINEKMSAPRRKSRGF